MNPVGSVTSARFQVSGSGVMGRKASETTSTAMWMPPLTRPERRVLTRCAYP